MYDPKKEIPSTIPKDPLDNHETYTVREKIMIKKHYHYLLCPLPLQINLPLPSATAGLHNLPSATANLYTILRTFTSTDPRIDKPKFGHTHDI